MKCSVIAKTLKTTEAATVSRACDLELLAVRQSVETGSRVRQ